ncbi:MAG: S41 family peptidase, partial [Ktedonobacterales bacterium]
MLFAEATIVIHPNDTSPYAGYQPNPNQPPQPQHDNRANQAMQGVAQVIVTAVLVAVAFGAGWFGNSIVNRSNIASGDQRLILQAWNDIDQNFVVTGSIDHQKMAYAAISAMVNSLGDTGHSRFVTPEELKQEQDQLNNAPTVGIGVYLSGGGDKPLRIDAIIPNSPAAKSTLKPGDQIVAVNHADIRGKTIEQVRPLIAGTAGTSVTLTVIRPSVSPTTTFDVTLVRASFSVPSVASYIIPTLNIAHIQILQFAQDTDTQLKAKIKDAQAKHVAGIILDLRDNPGGYLDQAVAVTSEFVPAGPGKNVLITRSRTSQQTEPVRPGGLATTMPLVILVNHNTASAAEITTGAIAINRHDVHVVGETTFGTGTVLQTFMLADGSALILGTEEFLLPNGQSIYHKGYTPDQIVTLPDNVTPVSPLIAQESGYTLDQIMNSKDAQLLQGIKDL